MNASIEREVADEVRRAREEALYSVSRDREAPPNIVEARRRNLLRWLEETS